MFHLIKPGSFNLVLCAALIASVCAIESTNFHTPSSAEHPLNALSHFRKDGPFTPVVMNRYYFTDRYGPSAMNAAFVPRNLTYVHHPTGAPFITGADFLNLFSYSTPSRMTRNQRAHHGRIHLNYAARAFIIMYAFHLGREPAHNYRPVVTGVPRSWKMVGIVRSPTKMKVTFGDPTRFLHSVAAFAVAMEVPVPATHTITIPHPRSILINGHYVRQYSVAFVDRDMSAFPAPKLPSPFTSFLTGARVNPVENPPRPARDCPEWLHDVQVTPNRRRLRGEPSHWRTWHPMIDPMYWCYYGHEHGSYPGRAYRPKYDYPTHKVIGADGRPAEESDGGFKTFTIRQPDNRLVVLTVHMHLAHARRFKERHHTMLLAVLSSSGKVEMELSMKADFGGGHMYMVKGRTPIDSEELSIQNEVKKSGHVGNRIFNVLNIDSRFPRSLDRSFSIKGNYRNGPDAVRLGLYEQWMAAPASCTGPNSYQFGEFIFDVRDPGTAMRTQRTRTDDRLQVMRGQSLKRILLIRSRDIQIGEHHCLPDVAQRAPHGFFYTDPYFKRVQSGGYRSSVRQFMRHGFKQLTLRRGLLRAADPWSGWYDYDARPGFEHIEMATDRLKN